VFLSLTGIFYSAVEENEMDIGSSFWYMMSQACIPVQPTWEYTSFHSSFFMQPGLGSMCLPFL